MTADLTDVLLLLGGSVTVYALLPLLYTWRRTAVTLLLLYVHIATVLTFGGFLGAIFVVPLYGDVVLLGGQVAYGGFMYAALITVIVGRDVRVLRNVILLTVAVSVVKYALFHLAHLALTTEGVGNPFDTAPGVFEQSLRTVVVGGTLNLAELVLLFVVLEAAKKRMPAWAMRPLYVLAFVGILVLDGVLFPTLVLLPGDGLIDIIAAGVQAKALMAAVFAVPLAAFVLLNGKDMARFEATPLRLSYLVTTPQASIFALIESQEQQILRQRESLDLSTTQIGEVRATVESLLDSATSTVLVAVDRDLRVTHFSAGAEATLGYRAEDVVGRGLPLLLGEDEILEQAAAAGQTGVDLADLLDSLAGSGFGGDWALRTASGEPRMLSITVSAIDTDNGLIGYVLAGEDVTERIRATETLSEALQREQESVSRLQSAERLRNQLVGTVSHELSTPVTSINGYLEMLLHDGGGELSGRQQDAVRRALRNTERLRRLVEDLRLVSQVDTGELGVDSVDLDLRDVVLSCREEVERTVEGRDLQLDWQLPEQPVTVRGDLSTLREVVLRLLGNAVKYTPDGGRVGIAVDDCAHGAVLRVSDTGIGIADEDRDRVFGRFWRGPEVEERAIQGAGLGLSIVATVVRRHGGRVDVESAPGQGTTITVVLPSA